jgi:hypothetical protein
MDMNDLATQLKNAKLKSSQKKSSTVMPPASTVTENSGSSTSSGGSGNYGTIGRAPMASMLDEMAQTLARRRERQQEKKEVSFFFG